MHVCPLLVLNWNSDTTFLSLLHHLASPKWKKQHSRPSPGNNDLMELSVCSRFKVRPKCLYLNTHAQRFHFVFDKGWSNYNFSHLLFYYSSIYFMSHLSFVSSINCRFYLLSVYVLSYTITGSCTTTNHGMLYLKLSGLLVIC